jgi:hypothetical protein
MKRLFLPVLVWLFCLTTQSHAAMDNGFTNGLAAARSGDFAVAVADFEKSVSQRPSSGALLNLGIVEWQRGHAGPAILAWERAQWLNPFDGRARQNLKLARSVTQLSEPELRWHETASQWLPPNAWVWLAGASLWIAVGALVLPRVFRWRKSGGLPWLAALGLGAFFFCLTANFDVISRTNLGFVLKKDAPLLLTPTQGSEVITTLTPGESIRRLRTRGEFYFVKTPLGNGWMERKNTGWINGE